MRGTVERDLQILYDFTNDELEVLVQMIIEKGGLTECLSIDESYKLHNPNHKKYIDKIIREIKLFGGNTFGNLFRSEGVSYREILIDVCEKVDVSYNDAASTERIEQCLLEKVLEDSWEKLSIEEKKEILKNVGYQADGAGVLSVAVLISIFRAGGFSSYKLALIIANAIAKFILGRGLSLAANAAFTRVLSILAGPIGWLITGVWAAIEIAGPAYRVTIPSVIYIAALRYAHKSEEYKKNTFEQENI